jgi:hypothetical protein
MEVITEALQQGIAPAIVVVVYLLVVKFIDNRKENIQTKLNSELVNSISNISNFITTITKNTIQNDKDKCKNAIKDAFNTSAYNLIRFVVDTLINNHIDINKDTIISNVKNITNYEYYNIYSKLNLYEIDNVKVSEYLKKDWMDEIEKSIIASIYANENFTNEDKILSFANKINFKCQSYITYVINHAIKG